MPEIACLGCGQPFERRRGRPTRHCTTCRADLRRERDRERKREIREDQELLRQVAESLREHLDPSMYARVDEYITSLEFPSHMGRVRVPIVPDRQPEGTASNGGSDDGVSTYFKDLAEELEAKRMRIIVHDWFQENPHWNHGL